MYEQGSFDSLNALGNLLGLRTVPTGVNLYTAQAVITRAPYRIRSRPPEGQSIWARSLILKGTWALPVHLELPIPRLTGPTTATTPVVPASPACGDGSPVPRVLPHIQPCSILGVDRNLRTPYITTWSLGIQRAISNNLSMEVTYVGNHATKLVGLIDLNQPPLGSGWGDPAVAGTPANNCIISAPAFGCSPDPTLETAAQPFATKFPYLGYIAWLSNNNLSNYNSLQVSMTQRDSAWAIVRDGLHVRSRSWDVSRQLELHQPHRQR